MKILKYFIILRLLETGISLPLSSTASCLLDTCTCIYSNPALHTLTGYLTVECTIHLTCFFFLFYFEYAHSLGPVIIPAFSLAFHHQSPPPHRLHLPLPLPVSFYSCHTFYDGDCMRRWFCCWPCSAPAPTHGLPALSPSLCLSVRLPWLAEQDVLGAVVRVLK